MKGPTTKGATTGWAVVTGASSGLGREFALALAARGHPVLAVARRGERVRALADEVGARGGRLEPLVADLSTPAGVEALLARAAPLELELLVNNAGVATYGPFAASRTERERELVRVNVEAIVALTGGLLPALRRCGSLPTSPTSETSPTRNRRAGRVGGGACRAGRTFRCASRSPTL